MMTMKRQSQLLLAAFLLVNASIAWAEGNAHFDLGNWRQYMGDLLDPGLQGASLANHKTESGSNWKQRARQQLLPDFARQLLSEESVKAGKRAAAYSITSSNVPLGVISATGASSAYSSPSYQFNLLQQNYVEPGLVTRLGEKTVFNVGAVLLSQQFGSSLLDQVRSDYAVGDKRANTFDHGASANLVNNNQLNSAFASNRFGSTQGIGARFGVSISLLPWLQLDATYQSRVDTEALNELNGVYADPAELDVPARLGAVIGFATSPRSQLRFGIEQVDYSTINSFTSQLLPGRFLSLLGDSNSPAFNWSDLTLYTASWSWQPNKRWSLQAAFSTRTQPLPDNVLLANALRDELADTTYGLFVNRKLRFGELKLGASFAPADIAFGGNALGVVTDDLGQNVEASLSWNLIY